MPAGYSPVSVAEIEYAGANVRKLKKSDFRQEGLGGSIAGKLDDAAGHRNYTRV